MMEKPINDQILAWLDQYSYDELTVDQISMVLKEMSEQDYRAYQTMVGEVGALSSTQELHAPTAIKQQLNDKLQGQFAPPSGVARILSAGVPLWLLGLMALGLYLLWNFTDLMKQKPIVIEKIQYVAQPETEIQYLTDTVYQEVLSDPIVITKEVIKYLEIEVPVIVDPIDLIASQSEFGLKNESETDDVVDSFEGLGVEEEVLTTKGTSVADDEALMIFLDGINE